MADVDLTGVWAANDGANYYIRQLGSIVCWVGLSEPTAFHQGLTFTNVFRGVLDIDRRFLRGTWADLPRGFAMSHGKLTLEMQPNRPGDNPDVFSRVDNESSGGFGASGWNRVPDLPQRDVVAAFGQIQRNDGNSMAEHLDLYKDNVVLFGTVTPEDAPHKNWPDPEPEDYCGFIRPTWWTGAYKDGLPLTDDPPDGDVDFSIFVCRGDGNSSVRDLDQQPGFWADDWIRDPQHIDPKLRNGELPPNRVRMELVMFARPDDADHCESHSPALLPGYDEDSGNSVLLNGWPLSGNVDGGTSVWFLGREIAPDAVVRVTGALSLDCHGWIKWYPSPVVLPGAGPFLLDFSTRDCQNNNPAVNNVELHPVYSIDVIRDPASAPPDSLTGCWAASDVGTYYMRQIGSDIYWLGISRDRGRAFANVFFGSIVGASTIFGDWADVPLGATRGSGALMLEGVNPMANSTSFRRTDGNGFGAALWEKLWDYDHVQVRVVLIAAFVDDPTFDWGDARFALWLNGAVEVATGTNTRQAGVSGSPGLMIDLNAESVVELSTNGILKLGIVYHGYELWLDCSYVGSSFVGPRFGEGLHLDLLNAAISTRGGGVSSDYPGGPVVFKPSHTPEGAPIPSIAVRYQIYA